MQYVEPTSAKFKIRFPQFSIVSDELIEMYLEEAICEVGSNWPEKKRALGQMLLTAHNLTIEGEPNNTQATLSGEGIAGGGVGAIVELRDRDAEVTFSDRAATSREGSLRSSSGKAFGETPYGERYYKLLRRYTTFIRVI